MNKVTFLFSLSIIVLHLPTRRGRANNKQSQNNQYIHIFELIYFNS